MMAVTSELASSVMAPSPVIRRIGIPDLRAALSDGWADFMAAPTQLVFLGIIYPVIGLIAARAAQGGQLLPLFFPLVAGLSLLGPVLAVGMYELSRRREKGLSVSWQNAFDVFRNPAILSIAALGVMLFFLFALWIGAARAIYAGTVGVMAPESVGQFVSALQSSAGGAKLLVIGNLVGGLFAAVVLTLSVVSFPMLLDRNVHPMVAIRTSIDAVRTNPVTMAVWGLIVVALMALGSLPLFVGLAVVMPVLGHATWHLYRRVVG